MAAEPNSRRRAILLCAAGVGILILAFLAGRFSRPAKVVERLRIEKVEVEKQVVVVEERVKVEKVYVKAAAQVRRKTEHETTRPDGTVEKLTTTETARQSASWSEEAARRDATGLAAAESSSSQRTESARETIALPRFLLSAKLGAGLAAPMMGGGELAVRLGPIWLGLWGMSNLTGGVSVGVQW